MEKSKKIQDIVDNTELIYQLGVELLSTNRQALAERWLRYAAMQGQELASATAATKLATAKNTAQRIHDLAVEILETFITLQPTEEQISKVEKIIAESISLNNVLDLH